MKVLNYQGLQLYHDLATEKFADAQAVNIALNGKQPIGNYALQDDLSSLINLVGNTAVSEQISTAIENIEVLPIVTTSDAGKFLRVSSTGIWSAERIPNAEEAMF